MTRPTIDRLFDHTMRVWRGTAVQDNLGAEQTVYELIATYGTTINRSAAPVAKLGGGGLIPSGRIRMYLRPDANVQARDVIQLTAGPDAPGTWEVDEPPTHPRGHHTEINCIAWHGTLPGSES